jgi:type II secretory pathway pseudopilin PulG
MKRNQNLQQQNVPRKQRGFLLTELLIGSVLIGTALVGLGVVATTVVDRQQEAAASAYSKRVADAARAYIRTNAPAIVAGSTATTPFVLNVATLKSANELEEGWAPTNTFGQTPCVLILQPSAGKLTPVLVYEGGLTLPEARLRRVAQAGTAEGGFLDPNTATPLTARGGWGTYNIDMTNYVSRNCSGSAATAGRPVQALLFDPSQQQAPFLYANAVPGNTTANTMYTTLNLNNNNISNVATLTAQTVNATTVNAGTVTATGNIESDCLVARSNPAFFVCPASNSNINTATANTVAANQYFGRTNAAYSVIPDGLSNMNQVVAENVTARTLIDKDNNSFVVDPAGTSVIADSYVTNRSTTARLSTFMAKFIQESLSTLSVDGDLLAKEVCADAGQPYIFTIPKDIKIGPDYIARYFAVDAGANWQVRIRDGSNNPITGASAIVNAGCYQS